VHFRLLGAVEGEVAGQPVKLGWRRERCLLALLLLDVGYAVSQDRLAELLWEGDPPVEARGAIQVFVSRLRRHLNAAGAADHGVHLVTRGAGYAVEIDPERVDLHRFRNVVSQARATTDPQRRAELLRDGLRLWRGPVLADVAGDWLRERIGAPLDEQRMGAIEDLMDLDLAAGRHHELAAELTRLVAENPLRERLHGQLMLALYRNGRRVDALDTYRRLRRGLRDSFGLEPSPYLQELHQRMLKADSELEPEDGTRPERPASPVSTERPETSGAGAAGPVPRELPADVAGFTGRADQLAALDAMLPDATAAAAPVVISAIAGTAGVGKTALALHWAHRVADRFPDGQLYLNLRGYAPGPATQPIEALGALLRSLGVRPDQVPVEVAEAAAQYRSLLAGRRVLVLLDNACSVGQVRPLLPGSPGCHVLVTSRDRLGGLVARDGARRLAVDVLTPEEAQLLLARVLGERRVGAETDAAAELGALCAHLPLALRITAAILTDHPHRSIAEHVAHLRAGNRLASLAVDGDEEAALRVALELSYQSVPAAARRLFRLLGLVPGADFTVAAAAALSGATTAETASLLDRLAAAHLVQEHAPDRFTFHDLLREYARQRADAEEARSERHAAAGRLLSHYLSAVDGAARLLYPHKVRLPLPSGTSSAPPRLTGRAEALSWLDSELHNLLAAVYHADGQGHPAMAWLLADGLRGYLSQRGRMADWLATSRAGLAAAEAADEPNGQAAMWNSLAQVCYCLCRHEEAARHLTRAMELSLRGGWPELHANAVGNLGSLFSEMGRLEQAVEQRIQALRLHRRHGWKLSHVSILNNLGNDYRFMGRLQEAVDSLSEALHLSHEIDDFPSGDGFTLDSLGSVYHSMGRFDEAQDAWTRSLEVHRLVGNRSQEAGVLSRLASMYVDRGRSRLALDLAETALDLAGELGDRRVEAAALNALAAVHDALGDHQQAIDRYEQALSTIGTIGTLHPRIVVVLGLAATHGHLGHDDIALGHARQALDLTEQCGFRILEGRALTTLAQLHLRGGRREEAGRYGRRALELHRRTGHRPGEARALAVLAQASDDAGSYRQAAYDLFTELGMPVPDELPTLMWRDTNQNAGG
jgi:DNA-binding SARP family transcriptional activator/Tfp pilus assembly protein PilF